MVRFFDLRTLSGKAAALLCLWGWVFLSWSYSWALEDAENDELSSEQEEEVETSRAIEEEVGEHGFDESADESLDQGLVEGRGGAADGVLSLSVYERLRNYHHGAGGWLGEARFNGIVGGFYLHRLGERLWGEASLGLGFDKLAAATGKFTDQISVRREFKYKTSGYVTSLASRVLYILSPELPLYLSGGFGFHYFSYTLDEAEVFLEKLRVQDQSFGVFSSHLQGSLGYLYVSQGGYFVSCELITLAYHFLLQDVDSRSHNLVDEHIKKTLSGVSALPPLNIAVGVFF